MRINAIDEVPLNTSFDSAETSDAASTDGVTQKRNIVSALGLGKPSSTAKKQDDTDSDQYSPGFLQLEIPGAKWLVGITQTHPTSDEASVSRSSTSEFPFDEASLNNPAIEVSLVDSSAESVHTDDLQSMGHSEDGSDEGSELEKQTPIETKRRRRPVGAALCAFLLCLLLVVVAVAVFLGTRDDSQPKSSSSAVNPETSAPYSAPPSIPPTESSSPSFQPSNAPSPQISETPTMTVSLDPTNHPTMPPTSRPTVSPTRAPTFHPTTQAPTRHPTANPTRAPTRQPTRRPTRQPTASLTEAPTKRPTESPTRRPTASLTREPTRDPTRQPTREQPTPAPTPSPTGCQSTLTVDKTCYVESDDIVIVSFFNCNPQVGDWVGMWPAAENPETLGSNFVTWTLSCGTKTCTEAMESMVLGFRAKGIGTGTFRVHLIDQTSSGAPFSADASSVSFEISNSCS